MGETQIYSQRLHGITEKRRILGEMDTIQRELELQRVKLQQLKRKSLRDRWLMDGLVPTPGAELENPLSETEDKIKKLEDELEGLNLQLVYLENPELKIENMKKLQESNSPRLLVNGDQSKQISDQKEPTPGNKDTRKEHRVIPEEDIHPSGEDGKHKEVVEPLPKEPKAVEVGHPIPAPRATNVLENQVEKDPDQASLDQKLDIEDQRDVDHDAENHSLEPQHDISEDGDRNKPLQDRNLDQEHVPTNQDLSQQNSESIDKRLEHKEENIEENLRKEPGLSTEDIRNDLDNLHNTANITLPDTSDQNESETQRFLVMEKLHEDQDGAHGREDKSQDVEGTTVSVSVIQDLDENITVPAGDQDQSEEPAILKCPEEPLDPIPVLISHNKDQNVESTSIPVHQSLAQLSSDQEQTTNLPSNNPDPSTSLPCEDVVSQVQISQVVVISPRGHGSSGEPSTELNHGPTTTEASTPPESQPLLHKPETDAQSGPRATNMVETRDKNPREKKTQCQCCVIM